MIKKLTLDANNGKMKPSSNAEREFFRALKSVAKRASEIVNRFTDGAKVKDDIQMMKTLAAYAEQIGPWATAQSVKLLQAVQRSNAKAYREKSKMMSKALKSEIVEAETGKVAMALLNEQVALIKSIPIEAGLRAQDIAMENFQNGMRATPDPEVIERLQKEMGMTEEVATNRARLIARTETARANSSFVQARASAVGATHYIWRTTMDGAERKSHAQMNGKIIAYAKMPKLSDGTVCHAGGIYNCRCWQDVILPDDY